MLDLEDDLKDLLEDNWTSAIVDKRNNVPKFITKADETRLMLDRNDYIVVNYINRKPQPYSLYATNWRYDYLVQIDVYTAESKAHMTELANEVERIVKANVRWTSYGQMLLTDQRDLSEEMHGQWRVSMDVWVMQVV